MTDIDFQKIVLEVIEPTRAVKGSPEAKYRTIFNIPQEEKMIAYLTGRDANGKLFQHKAPMLIFTETSIYGHDSACDNNDDKYHIQYVELCDYLVGGNVGSLLGNGTEKNLLPNLRSFSLSPVSMCTNDILRNLQSRLIDLMPEAKEKRNSIICFYEKAINNHEYLNNIRDERALSNLLETFYDLIKYKDPFLSQRAIPIIAELCIYSLNSSTIKAMIDNCIEYRQKFLIDVQDALKKYRLQLVTELLENKESFKERRGYSTFSRFETDKSWYEFDSFISKYNGFVALLKLLFDDKNGRVSDVHIKEKSKGILTSEEISALLEMNHRLKNKYMIDVLDSVINNTFDLDSPITFGTDSLGMSGIDYLLIGGKDHLLSDTILRHQKGFLHGSLPDEKVVHASVVSLACDRGEFISELALVSETYQKLRRTEKSEERVSKIQNIIVSSTQVLETVADNILENLDTEMVSRLIEHEEKREFLYNKTGKAEYERLSYYREKVEKNPLLARYINDDGTFVFSQENEEFAFDNFEEDEDLIEEDFDPGSDEEITSDEYIDDLICLAEYKYNELLEKQDENSRFLLEICRSHDLSKLRKYLETNS